MPCTADCWSRLALVTLSLVVSLAAIAAVATAGPPALAVTPEMHQTGGQGYFRLRVALPQGFAPLPAALAVRVEKGDIFLATAVPGRRARIKDAIVRGDPGDDSAPESGLIVTGRFAQLGPVPLSILGSSTDSSGSSPPPSTCQRI
jgi:hypothetical protein